MNNNYDVIIIGSGIAGLYAALNLSKDLKILILTKKELALSNSSLAQGGIAAVYDNLHDSVQKHMNDTFVAGGFRNDKNAVELLATEGPFDVKRLIELGVEFDKNTDGDIHLTLEGGHTRPRILHYKDCTGKEIVDKLIANVKTLNNVTIVEHAIVCDLKKMHDTFHIDTLFNDNCHHYYNAHFVIMATGGIGRVYEYTTNSAIATGDGISLAHTLGAKIKNLHYIQFHPTAFANKQTRESFLISESVRGEGAHLVNCNFKRFMHHYDERLELAPRDVVSRSIVEEAKRTGSNDFYLDITHEDPSFVKNRFPMIYKNLLLQGYDMTTDHVPIFPCQHYLMGGIHVDTNSKTTISNLYACGECSHTGVHGANRLASNSLLEAVVFSRRAALEINARSKHLLSPVCEYTFEPMKSSHPIPHGIRTEVRSIMQNTYFVTPDKLEVRKSFERICQLKEQIEHSNYTINRDLVEARSLVTVAYLVLSEVI